MKKKLIFTATTLSGLGLAKVAGATSTEFAIPSIGDLLGYAIDSSSPFLTALWPILGLLVGLGFVGWLVGKILHIF